LQRSFTWGLGLGVGVGVGVEFPGGGVGGGGGGGGGLVCCAIVIAENETKNNHVKRTLASISSQDNIKSLLSQVTNTCDIFSFHFFGTSMQHCDNIV
jgi:uncharacterized spore protein YtfJ